MGTQKVLVNSGTDADGTGLPYPELDKTIEKLREDLKL